MKKQRKKLISQVLIRAAISSAESTQLTICSGGEFDVLNNFKSNTLFGSVFDLPLSFLRLREPTEKLNILMIIINLSFH